MPEAVFAGAPFLDEGLAAALVVFFATGLGAGFFAAGLAAFFAAGFFAAPLPEGRADFAGFVAFFCAGFPPFERAGFLVGIL
ncbi:MAG: hypothetical protein C4308_01535 [Chitinophagaceae bacterium]